jgi:hypothetical protein
MARQQHSAPPATSHGLLSVSGSGLSYSAGTFRMVDYIVADQAIRHMKAVVEHCVKKAEELRQATGSPENYEVIVSTKGKSRPRVYVAPSNSAGIRQELSHAVLLKASLSMQGR